MSQKENKTVVNSGVGFPALLTLLFVGLKLTGYIAWSWLWVLSPIWITFLVVFVFLFMVGIAYGLFK